MNIGNCDVPVSDVAVVVATTAFTLTVFAAPSSRIRSVVPDGFEAVMPVDESAALICETIEAMPPEKSMPTTLSLGFGRGGILQRQGRRVVDTHQRQLVLRVGRRVGVGDRHRIAGRE